MRVGGALTHSDTHRVTRSLIHCSSSLAPSFTHSFTLPACHLLLRFISDAVARPPRPLPVTGCGSASVPAFATPGLPRDRRSRCPRVKASVPPQEVVQRMG